MADRWLNARVHYEMVDRRLLNSNSEAYRCKQIYRETEFERVMERDNYCRSQPEKVVRQIKAPEKKKPSNKVAKPQKKNPTVKQLESKLNTQAKKMNQMKKELDAVKKQVKEKKKQPKVERTLIQERYY